MKVAMVVIVAALLANNTWARLGETESEAQQRYGAPSGDERESCQYGIGGHAYVPGTPFAIGYYTNRISITATYLPNKSGTNVIVQIEFSFGMDNGAAYAAAADRLLEANSAAQKWSELQRQKDSRGGPILKAHRKGAVVIADPIFHTITFISDEYQAFMDKSEADKRAKEDEKNKKAVGGF